MKDIKRVELSERER